MDQSTTQSTSNTKTRDDSIQAAKKKLKTFRAKQAQVAKRSSSSSAAPASASQRNRASLILSQAAAQTVSNAIEQASDLAQSSSNSNSHVRTHSRSASRAGHGRGHSRGGSISITAQGMANLVNSSLNQTTNPTSNTNQQPSSRNSMRNSGIFSIPSSTSMPAVASTTSNRTSFIASTPASTHVRSHSRTGSRSTLGRSRPASLIGLGAINHGEGVTLAVELPPDASLLGGMGRSEDWRDINNGNDGTKRNSNRLSDASSSRKSWNSISNNNYNNRLSAPSSRRTSERPISGSSVTSNKSTTSSNGTATGNSPNPPSSSSLASPNRLSFNFIDRNNLNSSPQPPSTSLSSNPRRQSRHGRQASVSTKRESMEIMGGLGYGGDVRNSKRFSSSNNRMSGIQSASILFGGEPDQSGNGGRRDWDMRGLKVNDNEEDGDDRLTALEKLEGRSRSVSPNPPVISSSEPPRSPSARHQQQDQNQRSSLVQLPSFDDVHGDEAMDKRKSLTLLEKNEQSTSQQSGPASINAVWDDSSNEDLLPSSRSSGSLSQSHSDPSIKTRPMSMFGDSSPALEGLTTLMEEEEEEEASPIREKSSDSNLSSNDSLLENGESSEDAALKRARRASLTPRPLKLKSRPASLFISPAMRASTSGLGSNNNAIQMSTSSSLQSLPEIAASPRTAKQTKDWSFSRAQQNAVEAKEAGQGSMDDSASPPITARAFPSISSAPVASNGEMTPPASSTTPTGPRGIKPLRLASSSSAGVSSPSANANVDSPTAMNGAFSFPQNASSTTSSSHGSQSSIASTTSAGTAKRNSLLQLGSLGRPSLEGREEYNAPSISPVGMGGMRRSSIIYKTSKNSDSTVNTPTSSNANGSHSPFSPNESSTISPSSSTSSNLNNVSSASFEELKAKANRDASLLETSRKQVERLQKELLIETERSCKEYSELERRSAAVYSELERWSAEEKRGLGSRIEALEMDISKSLEKIKELERSKSESEEEMKERLEEFESERESWRDDEEGWRTRCSDAEKSSMKERARVEEEKRKNESLRKRNKALTLALEKAGIEVPQMEEGSGFIGEDLTLDLATVLRSPALGSGAMRSPALGSAGGFENSSGYFSPRSFNGANGKTSQDFADPPTTVKLLAEMRQQIFNLAGSLEHERKEHLKAREEADNLKVSLESVQQQSSHSEENDFSISSTLDGPLSSTSHDDNLLRRSNSNPRIGSTGSSGNGQRTKKHVFAYDSSMGSFGQSAGSNSIRSQNVSISMSTSTDETGFEDESLNHGKEAALTQEQKIQQQQQPPLSSSSSVSSNLTAIPSSSSLNDLNSNDEMVGLGVAMGGLQTLTEEEEAEAVDDDEVGLFDVVNSKPKDDQFEDLESGGLMNDEESIVDDERELVDAQEQVQDDDFDLEAGVGGDYQDDEEEDLESNMPPTPALDHDDQYESTPPPSYRSSSNHPNSTNQNHGSSGGSLESNGPASPVQEALEEQDEEFYDEEDDEEEEEEDDYPQSSTPPGEPRPEFLREWSFSRATAAVQASRSMKRRSSSQKKSKKVKKFDGKKNVKNVDIEDFFGILCDHSLPPLPPPPEALEMPPVYIEPQQQQSLSNFPFGMIGSNQSYDKAPRASMRVATTINPNPLLANNGVGAKRPPVARSAYVRESFESHQNESVSSNNSHQMNSSPHGSSASSNSNNSSGSLSGMGIGNSMAMATTAAGLGSKALSRMSLQGLTSAFSGLGGYLTSQSGAAVNVAANATRMCNGNGELSPVHGLNENGGDSISWIEAKRRESSDDDDGDDLHPAVRRALEKNPNNNNGFGSVSSNQSSDSSIQSKFQRRFLIKDQVRKPIATPVWQLDFETATLGRGAGPLIQL